MLPGSLKAVLRQRTVERHVDAQRERIADLQAEVRLYRIVTFSYKANNGLWSADPAVPMSADSNTVTVTITMTK